MLSEGENVGVKRPSQNEPKSFLMFGDTFMWVCRAKYEGC